MNSCQRRHKITNQQRNQIKNLESILPELANCDRIINRWSKELMTLFPEKCRKDWEKGQHLEVKKDSHSLTFKLVAASNFGILESQVDYSKNTIILIGSLKCDEAVFFLWRDRYNQSKHYFLKKIYKTSFEFTGIKSKSESLTTEILSYRQFKQNKQLNYDELESFINMSLVADCLKKSRSKGAKLSNKNSLAQAVRRGANTQVKMEFDNPFGYNIEYKNMLDAYKIVAGKYNYKKAYRSFVRELKKGATLKLEMNVDNIVYCTLVCQHPLKFNI